MNTRWALTSLLAMTLLSEHAQAAMPAMPAMVADQPAAGVRLVSEMTKPKPVYRKSAPRGATFQGYPCSQTRKTGYVLHNGCWYPREVIRNGRLVVPQGN